MGNGLHYKDTAGKKIKVVYSYTVRIHYHDFFPAYLLLSCDFLFTFLNEIAIPN